MCKINGKYKNEWTEKLLSQIRNEDSITARHHLIARYLHQRDSQIEKIIANIDDVELDLELVIEQLWEDLRLAEEQITRTMIRNDFYAQEKGLPKFNGKFMG